MLLGLADADIVRVLLVRPVVRLHAPGVLLMRADEDAQRRNGARLGEQEEIVPRGERGLEGGDLQLHGWATGDEDLAQRGGSGERRVIARRHLFREGQLRLESNVEQRGGERERRDIERERTGVTEPGEGGQPGERSEIADRSGEGEIAQARERCDAIEPLDAGEGEEFARGELRQIAHVPRVERRAFQRSLVDVRKGEAGLEDEEIPLQREAFELLELFQSRDFGPMGMQMEPQAPQLCASGRADGSLRRAGCPPPVRARRATRPGARDRRCRSSG